MIDYIALALEDQEERENNGTAENLLEQRSAAGGRRGKAREQGLKTPGAEGGRAVWSGSTAEDGVQTGKKPDGGLTELTAGQTQAWLETAVPAVGAGNWLEEAAAVLRGSASGGGGLYQRLRQAQTAAEYRPNRTSVALLPAEEQSGAIQGLAELDRAVQRDARRYDGGFEFY
ncbi:hypothetical protein [uncultured Pseudoflavonifractor sp.]|uniref:hypothetical protein n=1 Tax=uncultured Pseudoflavonifractor sp. TaxID=1221379 RepID=UPI0025DB21A1|nr:hypothetical protein [uncultured Pseudoflavonifractor sp.]